MLFNICLLRHDANCFRFKANVADKEKISLVSMPLILDRKLRESLSSGRIIVHSHSSKIWGF